MNKKIINGALLGLLVVAAPACSFVSCKDYDDDFASIRKEINADKADLVAVKNDLNGQITTLKGQLDAANKKAAEIEGKLADYAKQKDLDATTQRFRVRLSSFRMLSPASQRSKRKWRVSKRRKLSCRRSSTARLIRLISIKKLLKSPTIFWLFKVA